MKEILLCKYGEIVLKGANRGYFEDMLAKELRKRAKKHGNFDIYRAQSTIYIEPMDDYADVDGMFEAARKVFGIVAVCRCARAEKNMADILAVNVNEELFDKDDKMRLDKANLIAYAHGDYYELGKKIGKFGFSTNKKKKNNKKKTNK